MANGKWQIQIELLSSDEKYVPCLAFWYWQSLRLCWLKPSRSHHQCWPHCRHLILCLGWAVVKWRESCALAHVFGKSMADRVSLNAWSFNAPSAQSHYFALLPQLAAPAAPLASWRMSPILGWCVFGGRLPFRPRRRRSLLFIVSHFRRSTSCSVGPATVAKINWKLISCFDYRPWRTFYDLEYDTFVSSVSRTPSLLPQFQQLHQLLMPSCPFPH